jgi:hypothetical protein
VVLTRRDATRGEDVRPDGHERREPAVLGRRPPRPVDGFRDVIERYTATDIRPVRRLPNRDRLIDTLTEQVRPLLEAIAEAEAATAEVERLRLVSADRDGSAIGVVARFELVRARDRRSVVLRRLADVLGDEETLLRYFLLRQLIRTDRGSWQPSAP